MTLENGDIRHIEKISKEAVENCVAQGLVIDRIKNINNDIAELRTTDEKMFSKIDETNKNVNDKFFQLLIMGIVQVLGVLSALGVGVVLYVLQKGG